MKKSILFGLICLLPVLLSAQQPGNRRGGQGGMPQIEIKGKVIDSQSKSALVFATVSIFSKSDSSLITGAMTEEDGSFTISSRPGAFYGVVEFIGYEALNIDIPFDRDAMRDGERTIDLGILEINTVGFELDEITVTAERSETQFNLDKRVFNVGKDLANRGGTAEDILDNVPSVTVDIEGNVSLRGSSGVRLLVNGRPSGLIGADNANGLRSLPANMIESVEVITNPSARYEAEGMAGIINIILKKDTGSGFNGSFEANAGYPDQLGGGANVNYRKGKVNWFANYGLRYRTGPGSGFSYLETYDGAKPFIQDQTYERDRSGLSNSLRAGIDFIPDDKQTLTGSFLYRRSDEDNFGAIVYQDFIRTNGTDVLQGITYRTDDQLEDESNLEYSINYKREFSSRDHTLQATLQYSDDIESQGSDFLEIAEGYQIPIPDLIQRSDNDEEQKNWLFQLDYVKPLGEDHKYEFGLRSTIRQIGNHYLIEELRDEDWINLEGLSNDFDYDEDVHAAYGIYGNKLNKFSFQVGLRYEYSDVITELIQTNELNDRSYSNLFPSTHLTYELPANNSVQLSYSSRIRRPRFWDLNPFFSFVDSRNQFGGNPNLDPELTDAYEIGHIKYFETLTLSSSFFYRHTDNAIERILLFNPDGTTIRRPENLATRDDYGLELTFSYSGLKWLRLDGNANFFRTQTNGQNVDASFEADDITWFGRMTSRITFWKGSDLQLRFNYRAPRETTQGYNNGIASLDLGWSKDVMNKRATVTVSVRDVFNSRKRRGETIGENFYRESEFQWRARTMRVSFNYRINQKKRRGGNRGGDDFEGGGDFM
jgi:outer membrane receptor protein involved in Fe transport